MGTAKQIEVIVFSWYRTGLRLIRPLAGQHLSVGKAVEFGDELLGS